MNENVGKITITDFEYRNNATVTVLELCDKYRVPRHALTEYQLGVLDKTLLEPDICITINSTGNGTDGIDEFNIILSNSITIDDRAKFKRGTLGIEYTEHMYTGNCYISKETMFLSMFVTEANVSVVDGDKSKTPSLTKTVVKDMRVQKIDNVIHALHYLNKFDISHDKIKTWMDKDFTLLKIIPYDRSLEKQSFEQTMVKLDVDVGQLTDFQKSVIEYTIPLRDTSIVISKSTNGYHVRLLGVHTYFVSAKSTLDEKTTHYCLNCEIKDNIGVLSYAKSYSDPREVIYQQFNNFGKIQVFWKKWKLSEPYDIYRYFNDIYNLSQK